MNVPPISCSVTDASAATGISERRLFDLLNAKTIKGHYEGTRRLVNYASLLEYVASLPDERPRRAS